MALSGIGGSLYRNVTRRFSTLFLAAVVGAFVFDLVLNRGTDFYWDMDR
uniref:Complex III subunit 9 n=1 Tax=Ascaris lumbricoides TaxID=6252 RepID=A0A0M3IWD0_ASCLU